MAKAKKTARVSAAKKPMFLYFILLALVIAAALSMRLTQPDWYNDRQFHPDERWIVSNAVPSLSYPGKPIGLQYGSLPLYILATYKDMLNGLQKMGMRINNYNAAYIGGARAISALFDTGTIVLIFLIAALLFTPQIALLASTLLAFTALHIHASHFYTVDTFVTFFVALTVYFSARIYKKGNMWDYIFAGAAYAAAIASKTAGAPAIIAVLAAHFMSFFEINGGKRIAAEKRMQSWVNLGWFVITAAVAFFAFMPYAILDFNTFFRDQNYQKDILVTGKGDVPYNRQYLYTAPFLYYIKNLTLYTMGIPLATVAFAGMLFYMIKAGAAALKAKFDDKNMLIILAWMLPYFLIVGQSFAKFNRYMLPFTPFLALIAAKFIYDLYAVIKAKPIVSAIKWITIAGAMFYGLAFMNVYKEGHTWIKASEWIYANVPQVTQGPGNVQVRTKVLNEMWGDDLPTYAKNGNPGMYENLKWNVQEPDTDRKFDELSQMLSYTDYVMMADKRAYGTYMRLPKRYPINYFYFRTMLNEPQKFGYKLVHEVAVYPEFLGIKIKDDNSDESFQLYDHPHVYIFKNEGRLKQEELRAMLVSGAEEIRKKYGSAGLNNAAEFKLNPNIGKTKKETTALLSGSVSVFMWYALIQVLALLSMPLHFRVFSGLPDKGYGLSKVTGLFVFGFISWALISLKVMPFTQPALLILLAALSVSAVYIIMKERPAYTAFYRENRKHVLVNETVFLGAYMAFVALKLFCPDIHNVQGHGYNGGGEPMGMAYLSAIFNSVTFPPYDPWMSGYTLNYYYWGQLMLATVSKLLGILPRISYNLSLALLFALCVIAAFSLVYNMTKKYGYALLAAFLLAMAGNFHTLHFIYEKLLSGGNIFRGLESVNVFQFIWDPTRIYPTPAITELPFFSYLYGDLHAHNIVIPVTVLLIAVLYSVFTGWKKDITDFTETKELAPKAVAAILFAALLGSMMTINTWNMPPVAAFTVIVFGMMAWLAAREILGNRKIKAKDKAQAATGAVLKNIGVLLALGVLAYILFLPFHANFNSPYAGKPNFIGKSERADMYQMYKYFAVFFFIISAYSLHVIYKGAETMLNSVSAFKIKMRKFSFDKLSAHAGRVLESIMEQPPLAFRFIFAACVLIIAAASSVVIQPTFGPLILMAVPVIWMALTVKDDKERFALALTALSLAMILGTELLFIADGRMNTVFKFYMVAWTMLSVSVPFLLFSVMGNYAKLFAADRRSGLITAGSVLLLLAVSYAAFAYDMRRGTGIFRYMLVIIAALSPLLLIIMKNKPGKIAATAAFIFLLVPAVLYPVWGSAIKMRICGINEPKGARIDGLAFMEKSERRPGAERDYDRHDYAAIEWLGRNAKKIEPILEAPGEHMYSGVSRISIYSGLPTLIGWAYQVGQQAGRGADINARTADSNFIYATPDAQAANAKLKQYGARYVWVGGIERSMYPAQSLEKFNDTALYENVLTSGESKLYLVK